MFKGAYPLRFFYSKKLMEHDGYISHGTTADPPVSQQTPLHHPFLSMRRCNAQWRKRPYIP
jgi:hypothetical protein